MTDVTRTQARRSVKRPMAAYDPETGTIRVFWGRLNDYARVAALGAATAIPAGPQRSGTANAIAPPMDVAACTAAIRYIKTDFGSPQKLVAATGLGTSHYKGYASGGLLTEHVIGTGLATGTGYLFGENGPEWIVPQGAMGGGGGNGPTVNVTIHAATNDPQTLARVVANEIVQNLKRRGNFAFEGRTRGL
jgi:SLT domain-containing protein